MDRQDMIERFVKFLKEYTDDEGNRVYLNKIRDILTVTPKRSITISWEHLNAFDPEVAEELTTTPEEVISAAEDAIQIVLQEEFFRKEPFMIHARFFELPKTYLVKELGSEHINRLIQVEGIITRITEVKPFVSRAVYLCKDCGHEMVRLQKPFASLIKPNKCENCGSRNLELDVDKSTFLNFQSFRLQDRPESLRGGQMPRFVDVILLDDLVDIALPGDRVIITGVLRVVLEQKDKRPIFRKIIEANYIEQLSKEIEELEITPEDEQKIKELAKRKDVVDVIVESIAPAIYGMKKEKLGIALALFGGRAQQLPDGTRLRGESHILLVGDPGVAKCVKYDTNVLLADGSIGKIGKIVEEAIKRAEEKGTLGKVDDGFYAPINLSIFALDARTLKVTKARANIAWKRKTPEKMFIVKTKTGKEIKVTPTHPFFTFENGEFKTRRAKDLTAGDLIAVPRQIHHFREEQPLNIDVLPYLGNVLREVRKVLGLSQFEVGINPSTYLHYERNEGRPTRGHLMKIVETFERVAISEKIDEAIRRKIELLKLLADSDIFWDEIDEINVYTPKDEWVYDLQVPEHHNFIANDIFVHNSQLLRYVSNLAPRAIYTSGKSSSAAGLCVAPESIIETNLGSFKIGNLVEKVIPHKVKEYGSIDAEKLGLAVKTQDGYQKVLKLWKLKAPEKLVRITTSNGASIIVTPETKLLTPSGWVPAEKLKGEVLTVTGPQPVLVELIQSPYEYVYDLTIESSHSFIANGFIVHNTAAAVRDELTGSWVLEAGVLVLADMGIALIDEIDKMSDRDRSSIHEALEQQSYHHDFEILLADGRKVKIGELVDSLIEANRDKVILGKDTEILPVDDIELLAYDLESKEIVKVKADRVSRHKAPEKFIRLKFSNGREITVTPEHPIMVWEKGKIVEKPAEKIRPDDLVLAIRHYAPLEGKNFDETTARFLGFLLSEGFTYANPSNGYYEVGFTNTDKRIVEEFKGVLKKLGVKYDIQTRERPGEKKLYTVRTISKDFYLKLKEEFPEVFPEKSNERPARRKRLPTKILGADERAKKAFLNAFFKGDGFVDKYRVGFTTSSKAMAEDLQDVLLSLGIYSYIFEEKRGKTTYYKVIVSGTEDIERFAKIVGDDPRITRIKQLVKTSQKKRNYRDVIPTEVLAELRVVLNSLHINDGGLTKNIKARQNANRERVRDYVKRAEEKIAKLKDAIGRRDVERIRDFVTVRELSKKINVPYSTVLYRLARKHEETVKVLMELANEKLRKAEKKLAEIRAIVEGNLRFLRVTKVEEVPNDRWQWVYDVTVEPYHLFVSHGLVLHNTVSISKAGITATLNARTTVIAAANPKYGRFNRMKPLPEQLDLPPTLLSRFDLIFVLLDEPDEKFDSEVAEHILKVRKGETEQIIPKVPYDLLKKYIAYARKNIHPTLTREAMEEIKRYYIRMRKTIGKGSENEGIKPIPITPRQLEALIRLSEAHARMRLSEVITREDAKVAIELVEYTLRKTAMDEEGNIDVSILEIGKSSRKINKMDRVLNIIKELQDLEDYGAPRDEVIKEASKQGISRTETEKIIEELKANSMIYEPRSGYYKVL